MLDFDGGLPYNVWYQCKKCTHRFYSTQEEMFSHIVEEHNGVPEGLNGHQLKDSVTANFKNFKSNNHNNSVTSGDAAARMFRSSLPLKIKEHHIMRPDYTSSVSETEELARRELASLSSPSEIDGEISVPYQVPTSDDNNNNNEEYAIKFPKQRHRYFINSNSPKYAPRVGGASPFRRNNKSNGTVMHANPPTSSSIEALKKQLRNANIVISEINMDSDEEMDDIDSSEPKRELDAELDECDEGDDVEEGSYDETEENVFEGVYPPSEGQDTEEIEEYPDADPEEGPSVSEGPTTSNQSNDTHIGGHFLFKNEIDDDSEPNYEDDGSLHTPSFNMMEDIFQAAAAQQQMTTSYISPEKNGSRKRKVLNPCKLCGKNFSSLAMLKKHAKTHVTEDGANQHICRWCFEYFPSAAKLSQHLIVHADLNPNICPTCDKSFTSWATLRTHMKIHSGERPFKCTHCPQRFQTKSTLDSHLRIHTGERPHQCQICSKSFRTSSPLYRHMRSVHKGVVRQVADR